MFAHRRINLKKLLIAFILLMMSGVISAGSLCGAGTKIPAEESFKGAKSRYNLFMANSKNWGQRHRWDS
ncbi:MAG: hypothetical protein U9Q39_00990, partial [Pseudomonadota bacterium]|nr:hypothetical protein [Pseudomonadota bacterium]